MTRRRRQWVRLLLAAGASGWWLSASAQILPYQNDSERAGAGLIATFARQEMAKRNMEFCAASYPEMAWDAHAAYAGWVHRNAIELQVASGMRRAFADLGAKDNSEKGAMAKKLVEEYLPTQIARLADTQVQALKDMPAPDIREKLCADVVAALNGGKFDVATGDPEIGRFLQALGNKNGMKLHERRVARPDARLDAAGLLGRWRLEHARQYLSDGTVREGAGGCVSEFSAERMTSECARPQGQSLRVVYAYTVLGPGRYDLQILENTAFPSLVGTHAMGAFRLEEGKLFTTAYPSTANAQAMRPIEVEAVFVPDMPSGSKP
jgi:hypothetical protein